MKRFLTFCCCSAQNWRQRFSLRLQLRPMQAMGRITHRFSNLSLSTSASPKNPQVPHRTKVSLEEMRKLILRAVTNLCLQSYRVSEHGISRDLIGSLFIQQGNRCHHNQTCLFHMNTGKHFMLYLRTFSQKIFCL